MGSANNKDPVKMKPLISIIVVNYNASQYLEACFASLLTAKPADFSLEIIMVDNLSMDGSVALVREKFPSIQIIENTVNHYAMALNAAIRASSGQWVGILNPDTVVDKNWLSGLIDVMNGNEKIGVVQGKILFKDRRTINSVGVREIEDFHFRDIGFEEEDVGQYDELREIQYFSGGAALIRRECLSDVGGFDEDLVLYMEDIDYSIRCRSKGWKIYYSPAGRVYHHYHGTASSELCDYFCSRNRLLLLGKHFPDRLAKFIRTSHFYLNNDLDSLYRSLLQAVKKAAEYQTTETMLQVLDRLKDAVPRIFGHHRALNFFRQVEVMLNLRPIKIGIYDHAFHFAGGGQRYAAKMAEILKNDHDITFIVNKEVTLDQYKEWFDIDLSGCKLKTVKIPFFEKAGRYFIDEGMVVNEKTNPFDLIGEESLDYDIFVNANMLGKVRPLAPLSVFICHFPDRPIERFFSVDQYDYLLTNGNYGSYWVKQKWGLEPTMRLYPAVNMYQEESKPDQKSKTILSVARFETGGSKKQMEMVRAFHRLCEQDRQFGREWRLIVAGGSSDRNAYHEAVVRELSLLRADNIEIRANLTHSEILTLYREASIFWHACGLNESDPHLVEHFGMTTVEAMQNYCVPIVINGGGQTEIVEHGVNGFLFETLEELMTWTSKIAADELLRRKIAIKAYERSHRFNADTFKKNVLAFFSNVENQLRGGEPLDVRKSLPDVDRRQDVH